jgi:hypothetical protein
LFSYFFLFYSVIMHVLGPPNPPRNRVAFFPVAVSFKSGVILARAGEAPWFVVVVLLFHVWSPPWFGVCKNGSVLAVLWYAPRRSRNQRESKRAGPKKCTHQ